MNRKKLIHILASVVWLVTPAVYGQKVERGVIRVHEAGIYQAENRIVMEFDMALQHYTLSGQDQLIITPVIEGKSGERVELPDVVINGKHRAKLYNRLVRLNGADPRVFQTVKAGDEPLNTTIRYSAEAPYSDWMDGAIVYLETDRCGCGGAVQGYSGIVIGGEFKIPEAPVFSFRYIPAVDFIAPPAETIKRRAKDGSAYIIFPVNGVTINAGLHGNGIELAKIQQSLQYVKDEPAAEITSILIKAYASPEGNYESNKRLSERRAEALRAYISRHYGIPSGQIRAEGMGENWDDLIILVENDLLTENKEEVLRVIRTVGVFDGREKQLMQLSGGRPYKDMLTRLFPQLRRSDYKIEYTVPEFTVDKGKELLDSKPEMLSLAEMYHIAGTYEKGSDEFNQVFETAVKVYPDDAIANLNVAATVLLKNDLDAALPVLERYAGHPGAWNNLGVALMGAHRFDEAESYLKKARDNGSKEAVINLSILPGLKQAVDEYEMSKAKYDRYKR